jgi:WD40 repeat protein
MLEPLVLSFLGHFRGVFSVQSSSMDDVVLTGGADGMIRIYETQSGVELRRLEAHSAAVRRCCFGPNDNVILTASAEGSAMLWDMVSCESVGVMHGHEGEVMDGCWLDDTTIVTAGNDPPESCVCVRMYVCVCVCRCICIMKYRCYAWPWRRGYGRLLAGWYDHSDCRKFTPWVFCVCVCVCVCVDVYALWSIGVMRDHEGGVMHGCWSSEAAMYNFTKWSHECLHACVCVCIYICRYFAKM